MSPGNMETGCFILSRPAIGRRLGLERVVQAYVSPERRLGLLKIMRSEVLDSVLATLGPILLSFITRVTTL